MNKLSVVGFWLMASVGCFAADPTMPAAAMADMLNRSLMDSAGVRMHALVVGADGDGVALVGAAAKDARILRKGSVFAEKFDGVRIETKVKSVTGAGVELKSDGDAPSVFIAGCFTPLAAPTNMPGEFIRHLESEKIPLARLMQLVADQSGVNVSCSDAAAKTTVSMFLRNVTAEAAVEEICRASGLWFRRDPDGGVIRITTMKEYSDGLSSFREESTRTFTLLYPNVVEIASVIYGLYPDRTLISLGEEEFLEDDEYDLSRRFRRFRVLEENGNSQFMDIQAPQASSTGSRSNGGMFSFSRGSAISRLNQWDQLRQRNRIGGSGAYSTPNAMLSAAAAKAMEQSRIAGDTNSYERVYQKNATAAANIFVSMSRKNNMLVVRTSDVKVMDEITRLVKELDVPTPMVLLELRILELKLDDDFDARFDWIINREGDATTDRNVNMAVQAAQTALAVSEPTFAFALASKHVLSQIRLYAQDGRMKQLQTPTLLVANNEVSRIFSGSEYPLVTGWNAGQTTISQGLYSRSSTVPELEKKDVGDMLLISPNINADKTVTLRLLHENSTIAEDGANVEVYSTTSSDDEDSNGEASASRKIDYVNSRSITGTFVAKDGMTVMAGGLITEKDSEQYYRTPILGSIPLLGFLFRGTEKVKERKEMIVLITPHIIMTPMEGGKISKKLMKQLSDHPAADGRPNMGVFREGDEPTAKEHTIKDDLDNIFNLRRSK